MRNPSTVLVLMEFSSFEQAQSYLTIASLFMDDAQRADIDKTDRFIGFFEELPATPLNDP